MSETTRAAGFTPGPWECWAPDEEVRHARWTVGTHGDRGGVHAEILTGEQDALLIAAAPELYAALVEMVGFFGKAQDCAPLEAARAALSKVTR